MFKEWGYTKRHEPFALKADEVAHLIMSRAVLTTSRIFALIQIQIQIQIRS